MTRDAPSSLARGSTTKSTLPVTRTTSYPSRFSAAIASTAAGNTLGAVYLSYTSVAIASLASPEASMPAKSPKNMLLNAVRENLSTMR